MITFIHKEKTGCFAPLDYMGIITPVNDLFSNQRLAPKLCREMIERGGVTRIL